MCLGASALDTRAAPQHSQCPIWSQEYSPWLYKQLWGRVSWGGRVPYTGGHSQLWGCCRAACRPHPQDTLLCDRVSDTYAFHMVAWHCRVIRKRYQPGDKGCCFVTRRDRSSQILISLWDVGWLLTFYSNISEFSKSYFYLEKIRLIFKIWK